MKNLLNKKEIPSSADYTIVALNADGSIGVKGGTPTPTYEYVDLGLSVKWAKCNIGATKETDYGLFFQWGDTVGYTNASHSTWSTCPFNNDSSSYDEEFFNGNKSEWLDGDVLKPKYDAASVNMGGKWRMPTPAEFKELCDNTTPSWVENFNGSGVNGRKFTSKTDETKYIFIPTSGFFADNNHPQVGSMGFVWGSRLNSNSQQNASILNFGSQFVSYDLSYTLRYYGLPVRGVLK